MIKRRSPNTRGAAASAGSFIEPLESREFLSAVPSAHPATSSTTTPTKVVLKFSRSVVRLGQLLAVNVRVVSAKGTPAPTGSVELFSGTSVIGSDNGPLELTLNNSGQASYDFEAGNLSLFSGIYKLTAEYLGDSTHASSKSPVRLVYMIVPSFHNIGNSGLKYATVEKGHGPSVISGDVIEVAYTGMLASDGTIFDYATGHGAGSTPYFQFTEEANPEQVIPGFDEGCYGMKVGETRTIFIPSALGYGSTGSGSSIPPNADLVFLVTLLKIVSTPTS